ncbi:MAG TPA: hypothetical protein VIO11_07390, partial [Candidatus Methanoperedens sp.]
PNESLPTYSDLQSAESDYQWKLDLITEQTQRLDMYYATKASVSMTQREYKAWLDDLSSQTNEFIERNLEGIRSGNAYIKLLNAENSRISAEYSAEAIDYVIYKAEYDFYSREYDRITKNHEIMNEDIIKAINNLPNRIDYYNSAFVK